MLSDPQVITGILAESRVIAVVGLSPKAERPSHEVAAYLQRHGYRIIPVNPVCAGTSILGEYCYATLTQAAKTLSAQKINIDLVDVFRKSELVEPIADEAIAIGAKALWLQIGVINLAATDKARTAGLDVVGNLCTKVEHANWDAKRHSRGQA